MTINWKVTHIVKVSVDRKHRMQPMRTSDACEWCVWCHIAFVFKFLFSLGFFFVVLFHVNFQLVSWNKMYCIRLLRYVMTFSNFFNIFQFFHNILQFLGIFFFSILKVFQLFQHFWNFLPFLNFSNVKLQNFPIFQPYSTFLTCKQLFFNINIIIGIF